MRRALIVTVLCAATLPAQAATESRARIQWEPSFGAALKKAKAAGKPVMIDFWAEWCGWCHTFERTTFIDPTVVRLTRDFTAVRVDTEGSQSDVDVAVRYDVSSLPTILFVTGAGRIVVRVSGYQGPEQFAETLRFVRDEARKVVAWEKALTANPGDADALMKLGLLQLDNEAFEEARDLLQRAKAVDGSLQAGDRKRLRLALGLLRRAERKYPEAEALLKEGLALKPADEQVDPQMLFLLGRLYLAWGRRDEGLGVLKRLVGEFPRSSVSERARRTLDALAAGAP
jgi:thioredoxin-like negative regulator of GroEL